MASANVRRRGMGSPTPPGEPYARRAIARTSAAPMSAGLSAISIPASARAPSFASAVPLPPEMIAPAWPIRLPGGAVRPT